MPTCRLLSRHATSVLLEGERVDKRMGERVGERVDKRVGEG